MEEEMKRCGFEFIVRVEPENLQFTADDQLIEQVLINLLKNSIHALNGRLNGRMQLLGVLNKRGKSDSLGDRQRTGNSKDVLDNSIIPFVSLHKPSGSGIGLSLSKTDPAIAQLHLLQHIPNPRWKQCLR